MELKEGMYVRLNSFISKIHHINTSKKGETYMQFIQPNGLNASMNVKIYDGKASYNIIDLIEIGDYVNGMYVNYIFTDSIFCVGEYDHYVLKNKDIKSIVTKEQFESMEYNL